MASLQHCPITFQARSPPSTRFTAGGKHLNLSFSGRFSSLKLAGKHHSRSRGVVRALMGDSAAANYASALADVAKATKTLEATAADMEKLDQIFSDPNIFDFFVNPIIELEKKYDLMDELAKSSSLQPHTANFLNILIDMKRIDLIKEIVEDFDVVYNRLTETELAVVASVVKLESQHLAQIAKVVQRLTKAKNVRIKTVTDPTLVAGFTVRYGNDGSKLIDMSVKKQLDDIAAELEIGDIQLAV
ncbi:F-type H+-transporting ATPase subunit delta [Actinidia rufa]|uniref:F-type H+-transporting ATPase subunit delta n=1 Tax=Actinidia rufa TaxID=165716 RepID=A0A7J0FDI2_9ERIC|nr:F-type H+-transporting ATPase subunit delta [Actinidia rufa]GFY96486.1 F-type H+-transporting ATPase subunit delta [Actinidia rufa]